MAPRARQAGAAGSRSECSEHSETNGNRRQARARQALDGGAEDRHGASAAVRIIDMREEARFRSNDVGRARIKLTECDGDKSMRASVAGGGLSSSLQQKSPSGASPSASSSSGSTCNRNSITAGGITCDLELDVDRRKCVKSLLTEPNIRLTAQNKNRQLPPKQDQKQQTSSDANKYSGPNIQQPAIETTNSSIEDKPQTSELKLLATETSIKSDKQSRQLRRKKRRDRDRKEQWPTIVSLQKVEQVSAANDGDLCESNENSNSAQTLSDHNQFDESHNGRNYSIVNNDIQRDKGALLKLTCKTPPTIRRETLANCAQRPEASTSDYYSANSTPSHGAINRTPRDRVKKTLAYRTIIYDNPAFVACKSSETAPSKILKSKPIDSELICSASSSRASVIPKQSKSDYNLAALSGRQPKEKSFESEPKEYINSRLEKTAIIMKRFVDQVGQNDGASTSANNMSGSRNARRR